MMGRERTKRRLSPSDGTDEEWAILEPVIPAAKPGGRPQERERRDMVTGIFSVRRSGCPWRMIPHDVPTWRTVSLSVREWTQAGMWEQVNAALRRDVRVSAGRDREPRAALLDSPSITPSSVRGDARGSDGGKNMQGRTRHLLGDVLGFLIGANVLAADISDREGGKVLLPPLAGTLPRLQVIWVDTGSDGAPFEQWVNACLGVRLEVVTHPWTGVRGVRVTAGQDVDWDTIMPKGFHVLPRRWVVERPNAWMTHHRRLSRDGEGTQTSSEAFLSLAMTRLMVARLTRATAYELSFCTHSHTNVHS